MSVTFPVIASREDRATIPYELVGAAGTPIIAVLGGISSSRHVTSSAINPQPGWWDAVVGPGRAIDTQKFRVISIDYVTAHDRDITTADQADVLASALDVAGVETLHAVVGASYGGMVALAFGARYPARTRRLIAIGAAHRSDPMTTALRLLQRRIVALGRSTGRERDGLSIARGIAITSYVTPRHFVEALDNSDNDDAAAVVDRIEDYLASRGEAFAGSWTSERYNALSRSLDLHSVRPEDVKPPTTVIAVSSDRLVPLDDCRELALRLGGPSQLIELDSPYGHDAFLGDPDRIAGFIRELLEIGTEVRS